MTTQQEDPRLAFYRAMQRDRQIYCLQPWCVQAGQLTPSHHLIRLGGGPPSMACAGCIASWQAANHQQVKVTECDEEMRAEFFAGLSRKESWPMPAPVPLFTPRYWKGLGVWTAIAWVIAIVLLLAYSAGGGSGGGGLDTPQNAWMNGFGLLLFFSPLVLMFIHAVNQGVRKGERELHAQVRHLPDGQRQLAETALTAGLYGGIYLAHHEYRNHLREGAAKRAEDHARRQQIWEKHLQMRNQGNA